MRIVNVHERTFSVAAAALGELLQSLAGPNDRLWPGVPAGRWPPMRFTAGLAVGARGGHGPIRYRVVELEPGRRARFAFEPGRLGRLEGHHEFEVVERPGGCALRHVIEAEVHGVAVLSWLLVVRPLHDALLEDALDRAERDLTGRVARPARWSPWVRVLLRALASRTRHERRRHAG